MKLYRFYFLDENGHITKGLDHQARDDVSALEAAIALAAEQTIEIWQSTRRVAKLLKGGNAVPFDDAAEMPVRK